MKVVGNEEELEGQCIHCWHIVLTPDIVVVCCHCGLLVSYELYNKQRFNHGPHAKALLHAVEVAERGRE